MFSNRLTINVLMVLTHMCNINHEFLNVSKLEVCFAASDLESAPEDIMKERD